MPDAKVWLTTIDDRTCGAADPELVKAWYDEVFTNEEHDRMDREHDAMNEEWRRQSFKQFISSPPPRSGTMIVTASKLQRTITYTGIDRVLKLSVDTSGFLKRMGRSARESDSVTNLVVALKSELDKIPANEQDSRSLEVSPSVAGIWLIVLTEYTRLVTLLEKRVATQPELGGIRNANSAEDAANKLASQMQEQLSLPIEALDVIVAAQDKREREERDAKRKEEKEKDKDDIAKDPNVLNAPHRGRRSAAGSDSLVLDDVAKARIKKDKAKDKPAKKK